MATQIQPPWPTDEQWAMSIEKLIDRVGAVRKAAVAQVVRGAPDNLGACAAFTEKWIKTGILLDGLPELQRREKRQEYRESLKIDEDEDKDEAEYPPGIEARQQEIQRELLNSLSGLVQAGIMTEEMPLDQKALWIGSAIEGVVKLSYACETCGEFDMGDWKVGLSARFAANIAQHLKFSGDRTKKAYFHLRLQGDTSSHVIGLKRGKDKQPRHYSLFDANFYEITRIKEQDLSHFLCIYAFNVFSSLKKDKPRRWKYNTYMLFTVSPPPPPPDLDDFEAAFAAAYTMGDVKS